jgi:Tol biopolymer transport system component
MDASGGEARRITTNPGVDNFPSYTPAGELTFVSQRERGFDIYLLQQKTSETPARDE